MKSTGRRIWTPLVGAFLQLSFYAVTILFCLSPGLLAQGSTEPVAVSRVGPEGGRISSIVVDPSDSNTVYAVSDTGVFKSTDQGTTWSYSGLAGLGMSTIAIVPQSPATVYAAAPGNIFQSLDAGATWNQVPATPPNLILLGVDPQGTLFGSIRASGLFKSSDEGITWQPASAGIPIATIFGSLAIDPSNPNILYLTGLPTPLTSPFIVAFKSTNGGASWSAITPFLNAPLNGLTIDPMNTSTLYLTTQLGFAKSTDGGGSWNSINNGLSECFCSHLPVVIDPQNTATLYGIRFDGMIFKSTNQGQSWTITNNNFSPSSLMVDPRDSNNLYAATLSGAFKSTDGGVSWSGINSDLRGIPVVSAIIDPQSPETLYAATPFSGVLKSVDTGKTWAPSSSGITVQTIDTLAINPQTPNIVYAGSGGDECDPGGVFKSIDAGASWAESGLFYSKALVIDPQIPSTIYAAETGSGVVTKSIDAGGSWNPLNVGLPGNSVTALAIDPQNTQVLYAAAGLTLLKSADGGATWTSTALSVTNSLSAVAIDPQNTTTIYAASSVPGGLWKSVDGGASWQNLPPSTFSPNATPTVYTVVVSPTDSATLYAGTNLGVIMSTDGGESWLLLATDIGSADLLVIDPQDENTVYAAGPGGLFRIGPPTVTAIAFDVTAFSSGGSYTATITGWNLSDDTYFDVQVRAPGSSEDIVAINWQMGTSLSHSVPAGLDIGTWTVDGVRAHQDPENHTGSFATVSATITVLP